MSKITRQLVANVAHINKRVARACVGKSFLKPSRLVSTNPLAAAPEKELSFMERAARRSRRFYKEFLANAEEYINWLQKK